MKSTPIEIKYDNISIEGNSIFNSSDHQYVDPNVEFRISPTDRSVQGLGWPEGWPIPAQSGLS